MSDNSESRGEAEIDLGLEALIKGFVQPATLPEKEPSISPDLDQLKISGRWSELIKESEPLLNGVAESGLIARLYWILAHAKQSSLPRSFLIAPFDAVKRDISQAASDRVLELLREVSTELGVVEAQVAPVAAGFSVPTFAELPKLEASPKLSRPRSRVPELALVGIILCSLASAGLYIWSSGILVDPAVAAIELEVSTDRVALIEPEPVTGAKISNLGALFYEVRASVTAAPIPSVVIERGVVTERVKTATIETLPATERLPATKPTVNTSGPLEPRGLAAKVAGFKGDTVQEQLPQKLARRPAEVPVDQGWYRVLDTANIVSDPLPQSRVIGRVTRGDEVYVQTRFGRYAQIKSMRSGREAYIAFDALEGSPLVQR